MSSFERLDKEQRLRASIQRDVQSVCTEACHFLGLDITRPAVDLVMDVLFHKLTCYADDLEKFAKHAKRSVITSDDCKLLTRRNPALTTRINSLKLPTSSSKEPTKRRRTTVSAVSSPKRSKPVDTITRMVENIERTAANTERTATDTTTEKTARKTDITRATEELMDNDIEAIDLTFD